MNRHMEALGPKYSTHAVEQEPKSGTHDGFWGVLPWHLGTSTLRVKLVRSVVSSCSLQTKFLRMPWGVIEC